jgi:GH15 family glucan-1,4-alpha-glucosidase
VDTFPTIPLAPTPGTTAPPGGPNTFPPIAEYAFIADLEVTALIAPSGNVEWLSVPRPDAPSVFGAVLDRSAGTFRLGPAELFAPAGRRYIPGTNILETTWHTSTGWLVVRDALIVGPWSDDRRIRTYRRPPPDNVSEHVLVRELRCVNGRVDVQMSCEPVFDYGRNDAAWEYSSAGYGEAVARGGEDDPVLRLTTSMRLGLEGRSALAAHQMEEGDRDFVALSWSDDEPPLTYEDAAARMRCTASFWRGWLNQGVFPDHPWRGMLQRSALTLKGLTYAPTGALLAAATTSLPESPGGERNWDYRYSWVRDATFALWALYTLGFDYEANSFFYFIADQIGDGSPLKVLYAVDAGIDLKESALDHLTGYEDSRPVRIGNDAHDQEQHDIWGGLLHAVHLHTRSGEFLSGVTWDNLERQVECAVERWREPDRGIWENRGEPRHFTSSKIMCWVALDRGALLAETMGNADLVERWRGVADEIKSDVLEHGLDERGVFTESYGSSALDASVLLGVLLGFLPPDDPRMRATVLAIAEELTVNGLVLRYRVDETDDGLTGEEGTFAICSFWLVSALVEIGELDEARALLEKLLSLASPLGLFAEEIDARTGRHLGNFPQAFTHLALINATMHVIRAERARAAAEADLPAPG